jgi:hypothetical protein
MRLIRTETRQLRYFIGDGDLPPHAILSHTWGADKVTYQDMLQQNAELKAGYAKIKYTCNQASKDCLEWAWVDT